MLLTIGVGCRSDDSGCDAGHLAAIAADAQTGHDYVALTSVAGASYAIVDTSTLKPIWSATGDGTPVQLLAPSTGGVLVINGGAAARRIDGSGALLWSAGYADIVGVLATLSGVDGLLVADAQSIRGYGSDGTPAWDEALPGAITAEAALVSDRQGGAWLVGSFSGGLPPWVAAAASSAGHQPSGPFVLHFDGQGAEIGGGAWNIPGLAFHRAVEAADAAGAPMLLVIGDSGGIDAPAFGLTASAGAVSVAAAFGPTGQILWSRTTASVPDPQADAEGNLLVLSGSSGVFSVERWDPTGTPGPAVDFTVDATKRAGLQWSSAPIAGGLVVGGEQIVPSSDDEDTFCNGRHFLVQITTEPLAVNPLPSRLP